MLIRASSCDRIWACAASAAPDVHVDPSSDAADTGTAVHQALAMLVRLGAMPDMPDGDVAYLAHAGARMWRDLEQSFPDARVEVEHVAHFESFALSGHTDVESVSDGAARILDWKTGRKDSSHEQQMKAYSALLMHAYDVREVTATIAWVRTGEIETYRTTLSDGGQWILDMGEKLQHTDVYRPGQHCTYCPRAHECPGRSALARRAIADVLGLESPADVLARMPAEKIVDVYRKAKLAAKASADVLAAIKAHVLEAGDVVADGERLTIEAESRRKLDAVRAWEHLQAAIPDDDALLACLTPSLSKINAIVAKAAGRGKGKAAVRGLEARLRAAGAITATETQSLTSKRETP